MPANGEDSTASTIASLTASLPASLHDLAKGTRSASSNVPASRDSSLPSTRPHSMRSVSGSIDAITVGGGTSTASPLNTPGDGPFEDPMADAGKRSMSASPPPFRGRPMPATAVRGMTMDDTRNADTRLVNGVTSSTRAAGDRTGVGRSRDVEAPLRSWTATMITTARDGQRRGDADGAQSLPTPNQVARSKDSLQATDALSDVAALTEQLSLEGNSSHVSADGRRASVSGAHIHIPEAPSILRTYSPNGMSQASHANRSSGVGDNVTQGRHEAKLLTQQQDNVREGTLSHSFDPTTAASSDGSPMQATYAQFQMHVAGFSQNAPASVDAGHMPYPHPSQMPSPHGGQSIAPSSVTSSSLPSSMPRSPIVAMQPPGDASPYDGFHATPPQAYASMYGIAPQSLPSGSVPQSPTFGPIHLHQPSPDANMFLYGYNGMMPRPSPYQAVTQPAGGSGTPPYMMGNMLSQQQLQPQQPYGQQGSFSGPNGMGAMMDHLQARRGSQLARATTPLPGPPHFGFGPWGDPSSPGPTASGYLHSNPSGVWALGDPRRSSGPGAHRRMVSGPFSPSSTVAYMQQPGSPTGFVRPYGGPGDPGTDGRATHSRTPSSLSIVSSSYGRAAHSSSASSIRSPLLEDFRSRHNRGRRFELTEIRGSVVEFSGDQHGSRFTQEKLDVATDEEKQMVFDEILPHAYTLMTDVFGNYVVQKLFQHGTPVMREKLVEQMYDRVWQLSLSTYGCRVVQRALDHIDDAAKQRMTIELREHVLQCVRDQNANHVVQKMLERVKPPSQVDFVPRAFHGNVYGLAAHCYSCRVLQRIFEHCDEVQWRPLMEELLGNTERLIHDQYGNYVIQWVLREGAQAEKDRVIATAKGNVLRLSCHKFASNVVEQMIAAASKEDAFALIEEIMQVASPFASDDGERQAEPSAAGVENTSSSVNASAAMMMRDQYGNYVLQRFLERAEGQQRKRLIAIVKPVLSGVSRGSSGYTRHLAAIERLLNMS